MWCCGGRDDEGRGDNSGDDLRAEMLKFGSKSDVTVVHRATIRLLDDAEIIHCDFQVRARETARAERGRGEKERKEREGEERGRTLCFALLRSAPRRSAPSSSREGRHASESDFSSLPLSVRLLSVMLVRRSRVLRKYYFGG